MTERDFTIGIDLGGTSARVGIFRPEMHLVASRTFPPRVANGPESFVEEAAAEVDALLREAALIPTDGEVLGIGIGSPGPITLRSGTLGLLPNLPGWERFPLHSWRGPGGPVRSACPPRR